MDGWYQGLDEGDYDGAAKRFERALELAQRHADQSLEVRVLANWAHVDSWHMRWQACLEHSLAAIDLARLVRDEDGELLGHLWAMRAFESLGELAEDRAHGAAAMALAERLRGSLGLQRASAQYGNVFAIVGDWGSARALIGRCLAIDPYSGYADAGVSVEYQTGNFEAGARHLEELEEGGRLAPNSRQNFAAFSWSGAFADYCMDAEGHLDLVMERASALLGGSEPIPLIELPVYAGLALAAVKRRDLPTAARAYEALTPEAGRMIFGNPLATDHLLGLLAQTLGRDRDAIGHESALAFCARAGYRPMYAWAAADYSAFLLGRAGEDDHARGVALANEALAIGQELGMRPLMERVLARREFLKA